MSDREAAVAAVKQVSESAVSSSTPITARVTDLPAFGPVSTAGSMCDRLGIDSGQLHALAGDVEMLQVITVQGVDVYPAFQVGDDGQLLNGLGAVLCELADGVNDPWTWWRWLIARPGHPGSRAMWELLRDGEPDAVVRAAGRAAWTWRQ